MSRRYAPATEGEMDRLMLVAPDEGRVDAAARALSDDEDDALTSSRRAETLHQLGVITIRRRGRR